MNRDSDDLPPSIVGVGTWESFPPPRRNSYWIQYTPAFGNSIEFINNLWYNTIWDSLRDSYSIHPDEYIEEPEKVGLGTLARHLEVQEAVEGKKRDRQTSLSTQGSSKYPASKRIKEGDSSPIQESINDSTTESEGQELTVPLELSIGITPTPEQEQFSMSYPCAA